MKLVILPALPASASCNVVAHVWSSEARSTALWVALTAGTEDLSFSFGAAADMQAHPKTITPGRCALACIERP